MITIMRWTGREVRILRETALRMTVRDFASHTQLSPYAVRELESKGELANPRTSTQRLLDRALSNASPDAQRRFAAACGAGVVLHTGDAAPDPSLLTLPAGQADDAALSSPDAGAEPGGLREQAVHTAKAGDREVDEVNRRQALALWFGAIAGVSFPGPESTTGRTDRQLLASHVEICELLGSMYQWVDPRAVLPMTSAYADELLALYDRHASGKADALAAIVVGIHSQVGLWACHAHQPGKARQYLLIAREVAAGLDEPVMHAQALGALAYLHSSAPRGGAGGNPRRALELLSQALDLAATSCRFTRGWLATWRADQHATLGDWTAAQADLEVAHAALEVSDGPEIGFFARRHYGYGMRGHLDSVDGLIRAQAGNLDHAGAVFSDVQRQAANARRRIASSGHEALAYARAREPEAACQAMDRSLSLLGKEPYPMGLQRVFGVRAGFDPSWAALPCVRDLDERLTSLAANGVVRSG